MRTWDGLGWVGSTILDLHIIRYEGGDVQAMIPIRYSIATQFLNSLLDGYIHFQRALYS